MRARVFFCGLAGMLIGIAAATSVQSRSMLVIGKRDNPWSSDPGLTVEHRTWGEARAEREEGIYPDYNETALGVINLDTSGTHIKPIQVTPKFNLSLGYEERGGWQRERVFQRVPGYFERALDGDTTTVYNYRGDFGGPEGTPAPTVDLGGIFPINRIRFFTHPDSTDLYTDVYELFVDGALVHKETDNRKDSVEVTFPLRHGQIVTIRPVIERNKAGVAILPKKWQLAEFEIYGDGFVPEGSYISEIIDIEDVAPLSSGEQASWGRLYWTGESIPPGGRGRTIIRTRTGHARDTPNDGDFPDPSVYSVFTGQGDEMSTLTVDGEPLTLADYRSRNYAAQQGPISYDIENWSFWSTPYDFDKGAEGMPITSPGPRRYIQFRIDFAPTISHGSRLEAIGFDFSKPPSASRAVAEIFPRDVPAAVDTTFTYILLPELVDTDLGFDSLEIETFVRPSVVRSVRVDGNTVCSPCPHSDAADANVRILDDRLVVNFGTLKGITDTGKRVEVVFDVQVVKYGTEFKGRIFTAGSDEVQQLVDGGDASDRYSAGGVVVTIPLSEELIGQAQMQPNPFTPNGDGVNEEAVLSYALLNLTEVAAAEIAIYDLTGRKVTQLQSESLVSGTYAENWNGRDDSGRLVPPGIYMYRISIETDERNENHNGVVSVVY